MGSGVGIGVDGLAQSQPGPYDMAARASGLALSQEMQVLVGWWYAQWWSSKWDTQRLQPPLL